MRILLSLTLYILLVGATYAQNPTLAGKVVDGQTGESLAFVHLIVNNSRLGTTTDIDGRFQINTRLQITSLTLSYVGYKRLSIDLQEHLNNNPSQKRSALIIRMQRETVVLGGVVFNAGENPAHPIIRKVVENRKINNPEKIKSFKYKSYNKFLIDADLSEEELEDDETAEFLEKRYLFLMESITERKFLRPDRSKEIVIANRVSGLRNPLFTTLANSFQPFSFYNNYISIINKNYLNPISPGSFKKYFFNLQDSIEDVNGKIYIISFEPRKRNFDGLKGLLYIHTKKYAVQSVIAETANLIGHLVDNAEAKVEKVDEDVAGNPFLQEEIRRELEEDLAEEDQSSAEEEVSFSVRIQQKYELIDDEYWFPSQLNTDFSLFAQEDADEENTLMGVGRSYLSEVELLAEVKRKEFDRIAVEFNPRANKRDSSYWAEQRPIPLDARGIDTYQYIDSVGRAVNIDKYVTAFSAITTGKIPVGPVDLDIKRFFDVNRYEDVRLGLGFHTNKRVSKIFTLGGYFGYGFGDGDIKYGGDFRLDLTRKNEISLHALYTKDILESASTKFYLDNNPLSSEPNRRFLISNFDKVENLEFGLSFYFLKYLDVKASFSQNQKQVTTSYQFLPDVGDPANTLTQFDFAEAKVGLKYSFREKYVEVFGHKVSLGTKYPVIWVNYTKGFDDIGDGMFDYYKVDFKFQKSFLWRGFGKPSFTIKAGYASGAIPYTNLYNGNGSNVSFLPLESANTFQTMELNEFLSSRYVALYYSHEIGKIVINRRKSVPTFILNTNIGFGELENPQQHLNYPFKTMEEGYYESGMTIKNIYKAAILGFGVGVYYRYGPYDFDKTIDNFAFKITSSISL